MFQLDGNPHEIIIKDTKYYVKELYSADKRNTTQLAVSVRIEIYQPNCNSYLFQCWDLFVGAQVDIFGKTTVLKQCDLKTAEWNKFYSSFLTEVSLDFQSYIGFAPFRWKTRSSKNWKNTRESPLTSGWRRAILEVNKRPQTWGNWSSKSPGWSKECRAIGLYFLTTS